MLIMHKSYVVWKINTMTQKVRILKDVQEYVLRKWWSIFHVSTFIISLL